MKINCNCSNWFSSKFVNFSRCFLYKFAPCINIFPCFYRIFGLFARWLKRVEIVSENLQLVIDVIINQLFKECFSFEWRLHRFLLLSHNTNQLSTIHISFVKNLLLFSKLKVLESQLLW